MLSPLEHCVQNMELTPFDIHGTLEQWKGCELLVSFSHDHVLLALLYFLIYMYVRPNSVK